MREVKNVEPLNDYRLLVQFSNGEKRIKDMKPLLDKPVFSFLKDIACFNNVRVSSGAVTWSDKDGEEIDICPDNTYETSIPENK